MAWPQVEVEEEGWSEIFDVILVLAAAIPLIAAVWKLLNTTDWVDVGTKITYAVAVSAVIAVTAFIIIAKIPGIIRREE